MPDIDIRLQAEASTATPAPDDRPIFSAEELERYSRQTALPELGPEGQERLKRSGVLVVGAGGLGSPALLYLAAAGVGRIGVIDPDVVDLSNLQRQCIHDMTRMGEPKVESAVARMLDMNPSSRYLSRRAALTPDNAEEIIAKFDFVLDCVDDYDTKLLINDTCQRLGKPMCYGGVHRFSGQLMTIAPGTATLRTLFDTPPTPDKIKAGPLGVVTGVIGTLQALEAIKWLAHLGTPLTNKLLTFNALTMTFHKVTLHP